LITLLRRSGTHWHVVLYASVVMTPWGCCNDALRMAPQRRNM